MQYIKDLSGLIITLVVFVGLLFFRKEVRKIVDWIIGFRKIAKTKNGYELSGPSEPRAKRIISEKEHQGPFVELGEKPSSVDIDSDQPQKAHWLTAFNAKEYDKAIELLEETIKETHDIDKQISVKSISCTIVFKKNKGDGVTCFERLISEYKHKEPFDWFARCYFWDEQYEQSIAVIKRGLKEVEETSELTTLHAACLKKLGRDHEAISILNTAIKKNPQVSDYYLDLARLYLEEDDKESARRCYLKGLAALPKDIDLLSRYASFLVDNGHNEEALFRYQKLTSLEPKHPKYLTLIGNVYLNLDLNDKAMEAYMRADELADPKQGWIVANIGNLFNNQGFYSRAVFYLKKALEIEPDYQYAHKRLAQAMQLQTDEEKKEQSILKSVEKSALKQTEDQSEPPSGTANSE